MTGVAARALIVASMVAALGRSSPADAEPPPSVPLTSATWEAGDPPDDLHWQLLDLPGRVVRLALTPLRPLVTVVERYRIDRRLYDLVSNDAETAFLLPYLTVGGSDGVGGGVLFMHNDLFGEDETLRLAGVVRGNLDYRIKATYQQKVARLNGRELSARVSYDDDSDRRYFGVGGDSLPEDERAVSRDELKVAVRGQLFGPDMLFLSGDLVLTYRRVRLGAGEHPTLPALLPGDPDVTLPAGYGVHLDLPAVGLQLTVDSRDSLGRTRRGFLGKLSVTGTHDLNGAGVSAFRAVLDTSLYVELLPRHRVLVLSAGGGAATPLQRDHQLPLSSHVSLGRETHLRGYKRDRFLDRYGWWAGAEYRYPIHEHEFQELGISTVFFFDIGRAGDDLDGLFGETPRWSAGFGFQADTAVFSVARFLVGFSPEGAEITFSVGDFL